MTGFTRRPRRWIELACGGVSLIFCLIASVTVIVAAKEWAEDVMGDTAGPLGVVVLFGGWLGGGQFLRLLLVKWWDTGRRVRVVIPLVVMAGAVPVLLVGVLPNFQRPLNRFDTEFGPHAREYFSRTRTGPQEGPNRLRGRCVVVNERGVDTSLMDGLPRRMRAEAVGEVRSVVQVRQTKEDLPAPPGAWIDKCLVTVLDAESGRVLAETEFRGKWHEVRRKGGSPYWSGAVESNAVPTFLRTLPQEK